MWVALVLVVAGLLAVGATRSSGPRTADERLEYVSSRLACPICEGESVFESRNSDSEAIRTEVRAQIAAGQLSDDQIITYMTDRYGAQLLLVPKATGFDALVWVLPVAALVCAIVGLAFAFHRWRRAVDTVPDDDDRALVESAARLARTRDRLDRVAAPTGWIPVRARHERPTSASPRARTSPSSPTSPSSSRSSSSPTTRDAA